jgi:hypothetical protein
VHSQHDMRKEPEHRNLENVPQPRVFLGVAGGSSERRVALRYALHARVVFAWDDAAGLRRESRGHTRDVGQKGAFVLAPDCPPRGTPVSLSIFLPVVGAETKVLRLEVEGRVLRSGIGSVTPDSSAGPATLVGFAVSHQRVNLFSS